MITVLLLLLWGPGLPALGPPLQTGRKIAPVDEAANDPALAQLRAGVLAAAAQRDPAQLIPFLADPVVVYTANRTPAEFVAWFSAQQQEQQAFFWDRLRDAFTLGMAYERGANAPMLLAPYTGVALSEIPDDVNGHYAIIGSHIAVHQSASDASSVIAHLDYDVVDVVAPATSITTPNATTTDAWRQIKTPTGQIGWVRSQYARSVHDMRFAIERRNGAWKISGWAAGE